MLHDKSNMKQGMRYAFGGVVANLVNLLQTPEKPQASSIMRLDGRSLLCFSLQNLDSALPLARGSWMDAATKKLQSPGNWDAGLKHDQLCHGCVFAQRLRAQNHKLRVLKIGVRGLEKDYKHGPMFVGGGGGF